MTIHNIAIAAAEDALSFVTGLPISSMRQVAIALVKRWAPWLSPSFFLDWELGDWPLIYHKETERCLDTYYEGRRLLLPQVVLLDNSQDRLPTSLVHFKSEPSFFSLPESVRASTEEVFNLYRRYMRLRHMRYVNESNLRLVKISIDAGKVVLVVQGTCYEDYLRTNLCLDARLRPEMQTLRQQVHAAGKLEELDQSPFSNHIGIGILLFTADGRLILQWRSPWVAVRPGEIAPSVSGSLTYTDLPTRQRVSLDRFPKLREGFEELGLRPSDVHDQDIQLLGITRELIRGGQPEVFLLAKTGLSESNFKERFVGARDRFETRRLGSFSFGPIAFEQLDSEEKQHLFLSCVDRFISAHSKKMSVPLWTALAFWRRYRLAGGC